MSVMQPVYFAETVGDQWKTNIGPSINKVLSTSFTGKLDTHGHLVVVNEANLDMAGGLVSDNVAVPPGCSHFGLDLILGMSPEDLAQCARCENDVKVTFAGPGGPQANGSLQWNDDKKIWQVGANDGAGWQDTTYKQPLIAGTNKIQLRLRFDGKTWGFEGLRVNDDPSPWKPPTSMQNYPAALSGWEPGVHPQLQTEARTAPWFLREIFDRVRLLASPNPIPYTFD